MFNTQTPHCLVIQCDCVISDILVDSNKHLHFNNQIILIIHSADIKTALAIKHGRATNEPDAHFWRETFDRSAFGVSVTLMLSLLFYTYIRPLAAILDLQ